MSALLFANHTGDNNPAWHSGQAIGYLAGAQKAEGIGLAMIASAGAVDIQAQQDDVNLNAQGELKIISINAETEMAAGTTLHLAVDGGASVMIEGGNITFACPGQIIVHASAHQFEGPSSSYFGLPLFPQSVCVECMLKAARKGAPYAELQ